MTLTDFKDSLLFLMVLPLIVLTFILSLVGVITVLLFTTSCLYNPWVRAERGELHAFLNEHGALSRVIARHDAERSTSSPTFECQLKDGAIINITHYGGSRTLVPQVGESWSVDYTKDEWFWSRFYLREKKSDESN